MVISSGEIGLEYIRMLERWPWKNPLVSVSRFFMWKVEKVFMVKRSGEHPKKIKLLSGEAVWSGFSSSIWEFM